MDKAASELDEIFASKLAESHEFRSWFLSRTKFARLWPLARLLQAEQQEAQGEDPWWRNWRSESAGRIATKMLYIFEVEQTKLRFALHVESVISGDELVASEKGSYRTLAQAMMNQECFLNYMDYETVLLAPQALIIGDARTLNFDRRIPFETIAGFVPQFGQPQRAAA
ncbi:hypothetical protein [Methylocystis parvus]|uniref:Uncharacterized protein n=1 Tax=Methylocystis parvus TaxID=134 RepID=A0A6B8M8X3_9HYPH|nr:hypothetical protein [Methylocystis parvus]QGM98845.1 hypothetical protein F7D14_16060 [Methylocystis parvus]WBK00801.1 hypothetical protein MMG94_03485 [Methylocystis parvus OBBP]